MRFNQMDDDDMNANRIERQNGVQPDENGNYPPEIVANFAENEEEEEEEEQFGGGLNLQCWSLNQNADGTIQVVSYCNQEEHMYAYGPKMDNYYLGPTFHNGENMHMYAFTIREQVEHIDTEFGRVWRFNVHRYLSLAMDMSTHDGPTNANYINGLLNPVPFQE